MCNAALQCRCQQRDVAVSSAYSLFDVSAEHAGPVPALVRSTIIAPAVSTSVHPSVNSTVMPIGDRLGVIDTQL